MCNSTEKWYMSKTSTTSVPAKAPLAASSRVQPKSPGIFVYSVSAEPTEFNSPYLHSSTHASLKKKKKKQNQFCTFSMLKSWTWSHLHSQGSSTSQGLETIWHHHPLNSLASKLTQFNWGRDNTSAAGSASFGIKSKQDRTKTI